MLLQKPKHLIYGYSALVSGIVTKSAPFAPFVSVQDANCYLLSVFRRKCRDPQIHFLTIKLKFFSPSCGRRFTVISMLEIIFILATTALCRFLGYYIS